MKKESFETIEQNLRRLKNTKPEVPFRDGLRLRLVEEIEGVRVPTQRREFGWRIAFTVILVAFFLAGGSVVLAENSLPGQPLYSVKRSVENVKLIFVSKKDKPEVEKKLADNRIAELREAVSTEDEGVTTFAVEEVEETINQISIDVISTKNEYMTLLEEGGETSGARKSLEEALVILDEKQNVLAEIETEILDSHKSTLRVMMENLKTLKLEIEKILNPPTEEEKDPLVKGEEIEETNLSPQESGTGR